MDERDHLPLRLDSVSSDEYAPLPVSPVVVEARRRAERLVDDGARRTGLTRRAFLRSAAGSAAALVALAACTREARRATPSRSNPGGTFVIPSDAATDPDLASEVLASPHFVMDVQNHFLQYDLSAPAPARYFGSGFPQAGCGESDRRACYHVDRYLEAVFVESDTTVAVLSALPIRPAPDHPFDIDVMEMARGIVESHCGPGRLLIQGQVNPDLGSPREQLDGMLELAAAHPISAWKVYTHSPGPGWRFDDANPALEQVGRDFLATVRESGVPRVAVHKGLSGQNPDASPADIGPAAAENPDISFVVYHSGWEPAVTERAYDPDGGGVDRLVRSLADAGVGPGGNVYAELGSTWFNLLRSPDQAAHVLGKLLVALGPDNIVWGTDSIWYGSPQGQIAAFRTFEISDEFQEKFGYPPLDDETKRKILGANAATLHGIDPVDVACTFSAQDLEQIRRSAVP